MSKSFYIAGICAMVLIFNGCGYGGSGVAGTEAADTNPADTKQAVSEEAALGETGIVSDSADETREEALREEALRQVEAMDFTIQESPVDRERYDLETDRVYKEAFLKAVTNQIPIHRRDGEEPVFYRDLLSEAGKLPEGVGLLLSGFRRRRPS